MNGRTNTTSVTEVIEGVQVPLEAPTNLVLTPLNARVDITWTDPVDKFAAPDGQTATNPWDNVATWSHTIIVRKANSAPASPSDGELIYTETTRNQHQYTAYSDTDNVINNTVYYYAVYAITTMDAVSDPIVDSCKPIEGTPVYKETLTSVSGISEDTMSGMSVNEHALFAGSGNVYDDISNNLIRYDELLTRHQDTLSVAITSRGSAAISQYGMFAGGTTGSYYGSDIVTPINNSFTEVDTVESLSEPAENPVGVGFTNYIIFAGGNTTVIPAIDNVDSFNESITKQNLTNLPYAVTEHAGTSTSTYAMFGGGGNNSNNSNYCTAYNQSLTQTIATNLSVSSRSLAAATINNRAAFFNGCTDLSNNNPSDIIDIYDSSLTKTSVNNIPSPTYPNDGHTYKYRPRQAYKFGSYIILQLYYSSAGPHYSATYLFDSSLTLHGELYMPNQNGYCSMHAEVGNKYTLIPFFSKSLYVYEAV